MNTRVKHFFMLLMMGSGIMMLQACKKDSVIDAKSEMSLIEEAKTFFETQVLTGKTKEHNPTISKINIKSRNLLSKKPNWERAFIRKISMGNAVMVPLRYDKTVYIQVGKSKQAVTLDYLSYLMVYKNTEGSLISEMVTWLPDDNYWDNRKTKNTKFSGRIIVESWGGKFIRGYAYDGKGKVRGIEIKGQETDGNNVSEFNYECARTNYYSCVSTDSGGSWHCGYDYSETTCYFAQRGGDGSVGGSEPEPPSRGGDPVPDDYIPVIEDLCMAISSVNTTQSTTSNFNPCGQEPIAVAPIVDVHNLLTNACLSGTFNNLKNDGLTNKVSNILFNVFGKSQNLELYYLDEVALPDTVNGQFSHCDPQPDGSMKLYIDLNKNTLPSASREYATVTILHEAIHAYLALSNETALLDHEETALKYRAAMASAVKSIYGTPQTIADALAWQGLFRTSIWNTHKSTFPNLSNNIRNININHHAGTSGTKCN